MLMPTSFVAVVFDRRHHLLFLRIPPFVGHDAMSAGVASGEKRGMSRSGAGIGIVVIAISEICAAIEKHAEPSIAKLVAIAFQIVAAELVDHNDDNELGMGIVSGRERGRSESDKFSSKVSAMHKERGSLIAS